MLCYQLCCLFILPLLIMSDQQTLSYQAEAYKSLVKNLTDLDLRSSSVPSDLVLTGEKAFPVLMNSEGHVLMAASLYGRGRIVVLGHEQYLTLCPALVENALIWLGGGKSENLSVGVLKSLKAVADNLSKSNFQVSLVEGFSENLGVNVFVSDAYEVGASAGDLVAFMKAGGGVLIGGQAWNWTAQNPNENLILQFPGNKVSAVAGIYFSAEYAKEENLPVSLEIPTTWKSLHNKMSVKKDLEFLLKGISEFDTQGSSIPSEALIHGPLAFPIGATYDGQVFLAGTYYGRGRVILATHESFLEYEKLEPFWKNAFQWLDQGRKGVIGFGECTKMLPNLQFRSEKTTLKQNLSVYVCTIWNEEDPEEIQNFVAEGGGLVVVGQAWSWANTNPTQNLLQELPGNKILNKMGLSVLKNIARRGIYPTPDPSQANQFHISHLLHRLASHAIDGTELNKQDEENFEQMRTKFSLFLSMKAYDSSFYTQTLSKVTDIMRICKPTVSKENPLKSPKDLVLINLAADLYEYSLNKDVLLSYVIQNVIKLPVVNNQTVKINAKTEENEEWVSTGLYLSPGMETWITLPLKFVNEQWKIQIGSQKDHLYDKDEYYRAPIVIKTFPVTSERMQVWNMWGGLIYLLAPPNMIANEEEVVVEVAVSAPYYKTGVTKAEDWSLIREAPAPWAEFEFDNIILTLPSNIIRNLDFPLEMEKIWNDIMNGIADLSAIHFIRKERIVADVQISRGWMHAGYPVMIHLSSAPRLSDVEYIRTKGLWGEIHELGHNQQRSRSEFSPHTTEATCNLWSLYVNEEVLGVDRAKANDVTPEFREGVIKDYIQGGRNFSDWYKWTALETYMQLQDKFGWDAFKQVIAAYHKMSNFPTDNTGKMNLYAETFSQTVGMDLTGFFKAWGWPIDAATEKKLSSLPPWSDHPMVQYDLPSESYGLKNTNIL